MSSLAALLARWFTPAPRSPWRAPPPTQPLLAAADRALPRADGALPAIGVTEVIAPHSEWLQRLRYAYGADQVTFDHDIVSVVERYAQYVHLLPATPDRHFRRAGGLFRMGLEIGFYALQATDGVIFSGRQTITQRQRLEPRWRYATFLAGLCSELEPSLRRITVTSERGAQWPAHLQPLWLWLQDTQSPRYHVRWLKNCEPTGALGVAAISYIVAPAIMQYLADGNSVIVPQLVAALAGTPPFRGSNTLERLVRHAAALVIEDDQRARVDGSADSARDGDPECHPVDAMRRLVGGGKSSPTKAMPRTLAADGHSMPHRLPLAGEQSPLAPAAAPAARLGLVAPVRLHPAVRDALRQIIATLDSPAQSPPACLTAQGVFVPLHEFERRGVDPALAVRALSDARMLACDPCQPQSKTCTRIFADAAVLGIVLAPQCVSACGDCAMGVAIDRPSATP